MKYRIALYIVMILFVFTDIVAYASPRPVIKADKTYYDVDIGLYVLNGNVYIEVRGRIITAGQAKVSLGALEVWGSGGIALTQGDIELKAESVHVYGTQSKALIEGKVTFRRSDLTVTADRAEFDWKSKIGIFSGNVMVTQKDNTWRASSAVYNVVTSEIIANF